MKYFYIDPIAAAWMQKHFGMLFDLEVQGTLTPLADDFVFSMQHFEYAKKFGIKFLVREESLYLLTSQTGDVVEWPPDTGFLEFRILGEVTDYDRDYKIVLRNGITFMWPERE